MLDRLETIATGLDHPEGVAWGPDGRVYAGGEAGQIYAIGIDGEVEEIASTGGFMYGITVDGDGTVFACDFGRAEIARVTGRGEISTYSTGTPDHPIRVPNFTAFDEAGRPLRHRLRRVGRRRRAGVPGRRRRRDRRLDRPRAGLPERVLPVGRGRRAPRGRVEPAAGRAGTDRRRRGGGSSGDGRRSGRLAARRHRARGRRHDVRRAATAPTASGASRPRAGPRSGWTTPTASP